MNRMGNTSGSMSGLSTGVRLSEQKSQETEKRRSLHSEEHDYLTV